MTVLRESILTLDSTLPVVCNPFPAFDLQRLSAPQIGDGGIPEDERKWIGYGLGRNLISPPYLRQEGYPTQYSTNRIRTIVLENQHLRAEILIDLGGRLWSLFDKANNRHLLHTPSNLILRNLALRNAWFCGGIEWNIGTQGHTVFTCDPLFASVITDGEGNEFLRMYEYERILGVVFQVDVHLPGESKFLFVHVRIVNKTSEEIPLYWWSNIAIPEKTGHRVLVPADSAICNNYDRGLRTASIPNDGGRDVSYPTNIGHAIDYFYRIREQNRPWIAAIDGEGEGLIQFSTKLLRGRKLFAWGNSGGGRNWLEFLGNPCDRPYAEIQAGLATTQYGCVPMPANSEWEWTEGYGSISAGADSIHGCWDSALDAVETSLRAEISNDVWNGYDNRFCFDARRPAGRIINRGSPWGFVEQELRNVKSNQVLYGPETPFYLTSSGGVAQRALTLLRTGKFPESDIGDFPDSCLTGESWIDLLLAIPKSDHTWESLLHLGSLYFQKGVVDEAEKAWQESLKKGESVPVMRNLALLYSWRKQYEEALRYYRMALGLRKPCCFLCVEVAEWLRRVNMPSVIWQFERSWSRDVYDLPRVRLTRISALLKEGALMDAKQMLLDPGVVPADLLENDPVLTNLWLDLLVKEMMEQKGESLSDDELERLRCSLPPAHLDYRMNSDILG